MNGPILKQEEGFTLYKCVNTELYKIDYESETIERDSNLYNIASNFDTLVRLKQPKQNLSNGVKSEIKRLEDKIDKVGRMISSSYDDEKYNLANKALEAISSIQESRP